MSLLDLIAAAIAARPSSIAVRDRQRAITYAELDAEAEQIARAVAAQAGDDMRPVVIDTPRSVALVVTILGILRSGRGCVPIDRAQPKRRQDAAIAIVREAPNEGGGLAYVLFTSGTTGEPKGVAMSQRALDALVGWHCAQHGARPAPITSQFAAITFDVAWQEILTTLALGGTLVIVPDDVKQDPARLVAFAHEERVTSMFLPTAFLQSVAQTQAELPLLEDVYVAGSQLRITPAIRAWFTRNRATLHNHYGPAETHVVTSFTLRSAPAEWDDLPSIGTALPHVQTHITDDGELWLAGPCLAEGYFGRPALTKERFVVDAAGARWYMTGDRVADRGGALAFLGRIDRQVKIDGHRVEPAEIEALIAQHPSVADVHVGVSPDSHGRARLVAYVVGRGIDLGVACAVRELAPPFRDLVAERLPAWSVPSVWLYVRALPLNAHGKVDPARLPGVPRQRPALAAAFSAPATPTELALARLWTSALDLDELGRDDNLFDLGGSSLLAVSLAAETSRAFGADVPLSAIYAYPTVRTLAGWLDNDRAIDAARRPAAVLRGAAKPDAEPIAIIGMACRFPGATPEALWQLLLAGRDAITRAPGLGTAHGGQTVHAGGVLPDIDKFDEGLFGLSAAQARLIDPQHRFFLECCVEALEDAACVRGSVGVFAGAGPSTYLLNNLLVDRATRTLTSSVEDFGLLMANDKEFLAGRTSYALDLRGPSVNVNAACATSLFAAHYAVAALRAGDCEVAIAGAASIQVPQLHGYTYQESMPFSPDGICRVFDRDSAGTVFGSGVGVVVMKRLSRALADGDDIYAVIRGTGISNDGAQKVGMAAPSVDGQERAIRAALAAAAIAPSTIRYVEAHGTGTQVGDAIEIEALTRAYAPLAVGTCGIGSIKTNLGHLGWAAGMAGLIKAILVLRHHRVPPTIHFTTPNPELRLEQRPFFVEHRERALPIGDEPIRAAVSAFGLGGFNAHVILEEAPPRAAQRSLRTHYVLPFSARSEDACRALVERHIGETAQCGLAGSTTRGTTAPTADLAHTLALGRTHHAHRRAAVVAHDEPLAPVLAGLLADAPAPVVAGKPVVGLFAGHGAERRGLGAALYAGEPVFRATIDRFDALLGAELGKTASELIYPADSTTWGAPIRNVVEVHAAAFALQLALWQLWEAQGVKLDVLLGHSLGQYAAACAAGVFSPEDGMRVVLERGRAIEAMDTRGSMAALEADETTARRLISDAGSPLDIAVLNGPTNTVVSGLRADLEAFAAFTAQHGVACKMLGSLRAGHSRLMSGAVDRLVAAFGRISLSPPCRTLIGNASGRAVGAEAADPAWWGAHLRSTVRFADCLRSALELGAGAFVETSGSPGLLGLAQQVLEPHTGPWIAVLRPQDDARRSFARAIATAYEAGLELDWRAIAGGVGRPAHVATYPFEKRRHWTGPAPIHGPVTTTSPLLHDIVWRSVEPPTGVRTARPWGVIGTGSPWQQELAAALFEQTKRLGVSTTDPRESTLRAADDVVVLLDDRLDRIEDDPVHALEAPMSRLIAVVQELIEARRAPRLWLVTRGAHAIAERDDVAPMQRALWGAGRVIGLEHPELRVALVDGRTGLASDVATWIACGSVETEVALCDGRAFAARLVRSDREPAPYTPRADRTYLIAGGLTGVGLWSAEVLAAAGARKLVLAGRRAPSDAAAARIAALRAAGCDVTTISLDVTDEAAVDALIARYAGDLAGIVHSAGALADCLVSKLTWPACLPALDAKMRGAWHLHRAAIRHRAPLELFALYSSATAVHGNYGQAAYAAANGFLDGLACERRRAGLPGVALAWGVIADVGHVANDAQLLAALRRRGLGSIDAASAPDLLLGHAVGHAANVLVLPNDWPLYIAAHDLDAVPFYRELAEPTVKATAPFHVRLAAAPAESRTHLLSDHVQRLLRRYVDLAVPYPDDRPLADLNLDSLSTIQLRNELQQTLCTPLPPRLLARHPTIGAIVRHLLADVLDFSRAADVAEPMTPGPAPQLESELVMSLEQQRWLRLARDVGYGQRVIPILFHDRLDRTAFSTSLRCVVERHEILRQCYPNASAIRIVPVDAVVPRDEDLYIDLTALPPHACANAIGNVLAQIRDNLPDPAERPSWILRCLELPDRRFLVALGGQHLEFDGSGLSVFVDELREVYRRGTAAALPEVVPYREYAAAQAAYLARDIAADRAFFEGLFGGVPRTTRLPRAELATATRAHPSRRFTPRGVLAEWGHCCAVAGELQINPFSILLASYATLLAEIVDAPSVSIAMIRSARVDRRFASTIGPFTMPFPVPIHIHGWTPKELVHQVDATLAALDARPRYPSTDLLTRIRAFAEFPLDTYFSDAGINFTHYRKAEQQSSPRVEIIEVLGEVDHPLLAGYDFGSLRRIPGLHLVLSLEDGMVRGNYWYHAHRFTAAEVSAWAARHADILNKLLALGSANVVHGVA